MAVYQGCLLDLELRKTRLDKLLHRSMLTGATRVSVKLAVVILSLLFHYHTSHASPPTHQCNSKVGCAVLIKADTNRSSTERSMEYTLPFSSFMEGRTGQGATATEPAS